MASTLQAAAGGLATRRSSGRGGALHQQLVARASSVERVDEPSAPAGDVLAVDAEQLVADAHAPLGGRRALGVHLDHHVGVVEAEAERAADGREPNREAQRRRHVRGRWGTRATIVGS